jgi:ubiquinone/menaquinone biosynthesis C-methylase UbiE
MNESNTIEFYEKYYIDGADNVKRALSALEQASHLDELLGINEIRSLIDVGAGQGALVDILSKSGRAGRIVAAEVSPSGVDAIASRKLHGVEIVKFDGYKLPFKDKEFDIAVCMHVLEHVDHERMFLREIARISRHAVIEVPLEHTLRIDRAIKISKKFGHINYYSLETFLNKLSTSGLAVSKILVDPVSMKTERYLYGYLVGSTKRWIRQKFLTAFPSIATKIMVYNCAVLVDCGE